MRTLQERDNILERLWLEFGNVPMDPETECMEEPFLDFPAGTNREDVWRWFDERHSKGVTHLLTGDGVDRTEEIADLYYLNTKCFECTSSDCAFNNDQICKFPLVYGHKPTITEEEGCVSSVVDFFA